MRSRSSSSVLALEAEVGLERVGLRASTAMADLAVVAVLVSGWFLMQRLLAQPRLSPLVLVWLLLLEATAPLAVGLSLMAAMLAALLALKGEVAVEAKVRA